MFKNDHNTVSITRPPQGIPPLSNWYDADYYSGKGKSNWKHEYNWMHFGTLFREWWKFLLEGFPESKSFLDVGCAKGICERAFIEVCNGNGFTDKIIEGFDHSEYAIANADEKAKPFIKRAALHEYEFDRNFDVMISLDVFEHIPLLQVEDFLKRSRKYINDCIFCVIALDEPRQWAEKSHINLRTREAWHETFLECGWQHTCEHATMQSLAMATKFIKAVQVEVFIYGA